MALGPRPPAASEPKSVCDSRAQTLDRHERPLPPRGWGLGGQRLFRSPLGVSCWLGDGWTPCPVGCTVHEDSSMQGCWLVQGNPSIVGEAEVAQKLSAEIHATPREASRTQHQGEQGRCGVRAVTPPVSVALSQEPRAVTLQLRRNQPKLWAQVGRPGARVFLQGTWQPGAVLGEVFLVLSLPWPEPSPFGLIEYGRLSCAKWGSHLAPLFRGLRGARPCSG